MKCVQGHFRNMIGDRADLFLAEKVNRMNQFHSIGSISRPKHFRAIPCVTEGDDGTGLACFFSFEFHDGLHDFPHKGR